MNSEEMSILLDPIAATGSRNAKEDMLAAVIGDPFVAKVLRYAYDPFITFGVTLPNTPTDGEAVFELEPLGVFDMLDNLAARRLTGNKARDMVAAVRSYLEPRSGELLWRILAKDLRAGFQKSTLNKVIPGLIPTFDVMLSKPYEAKRIKTWPVAVEPKLDGLRAFGLVKEKARFFSRVGNHFPLSIICRTRSF